MSGWRTIAARVHAQVLYVSSIVRAITALHNLVSNKISFEQARYVTNAFPKNKIFEQCRLKFVLPLD